MKPNSSSSSLVEFRNMTFDLGWYAQNEELREAICDGEYEDNELWLVDQFLDPELPVVELGGSIGVVSCAINKLLRYPEKHIVVEANPYLIPMLSTNKTGNGCQFEIVNRAIGYGSPWITLYFSMSTPCLGNNFMEYDEQVRVRTTSLRDLLNKSKLENISLVSDIEGAEEGLFNREMDTLAEHVKLLIFESHPEYLGLESVRHQLNSLVSRGFEQVFSEASFHVFRNQRIS